MSEHDLFDETLLRFQDAPKHFEQRYGKRLHRATLHRWGTVGLRGVVLETLKIRNERYTSTEAIERFLRAQNAPKPSVRDELQAEGLA